MTDFYLGKSGHRELKIYSICTIVSNFAQYSEMKQSFISGGFCEDACNYYIVDNTSGNTMDGYQACNYFLSKCRGRYIIICHQDIVLERHGRIHLDSLIDSLNNFDRSWAVAGNAGASSMLGRPVTISDPHGRDRLEGTFPCKVQSLDENFLVINGLFDLQCSKDLRGFHLYGTDLCLSAKATGLNCYVINFHLTHLSGGRRNADFYEKRKEFIDVWSSKSRRKIVYTQSTIMFLEPSKLLRRLLNSRAIFYNLERAIFRIKGIIKVFKAM